MKTGGRFLESSVVALVSLDGEVQLYAETLRYLAWKLVRAGAEVVRLGCDGTLNACTSLNATNKASLSKYGKHPVCRRCRASQTAIPVSAVLDVLSEDSITGEAEAEFLARLRSSLYTHRQAEVALDMTYEGFDVVKGAFFDFAITTKLSHTSRLDDVALERLVAGVEDQLILLKALRRLQSSAKITHVVYVNGNYGQNTLIRTFFSRQSIRCLSVEPQLTSQSVLTKVLLAENRFELRPEALMPMAATHASKPLAHRAIREVLRNFGARIDGGDFNAYTSLSHDESTISQLEALNTFMRDYSRVHAFFLSSEDELIPHIVTHAALNKDEFSALSGYQSQVEFTKGLILEARKHPETAFVVRLHPRMAVNKREAFESEEHLTYKEVLSGIKIPPNVFVLYGDSKISSYYVISQADLVIIGWSTIGLEALLLGAPVVSVFPACLMYPLAALSNQPGNAEELHAALFGVTDYGVANDEALLRWLAHAYEEQFFATAAPRGQGGMVGKAYRTCYRLLSRCGLYGVLARLVSLLPSARVNLDPLQLMSAQETKTTVGKSVLAREIEGYRQQYLATLSNYCQVLSK